MTRLLPALITLLFASIAASQPADLVLINAKIWTGDPANPAARSLAVADGRITALSARNLDDLAGPTTTVIDAQNRRVLPGLIDAHVHLAGAARDAAALDLRPATSKADLLERLADYAEDFPDDAWILGARWTADSWPDPTPPTADEIQAAVGARPAALERMDGHQTLASTRALEIAGITAGTPDPPGGKIERDAQGNPTGALLEQAAGLLAPHIPELSDDRFRRLLAEAAQHAASRGVTRVGSIDPLAVVRGPLRALAAQGKLPIRVASTISEPTDDLEEWSPALRWAAANPNPAPGLTVIGFKGYMDGTLGSRTAWMTEPFHDNPASPDNAGFPLAMAESGDLKTLIERGAARGLQPIVHAIGDRANKTALDWFAGLGDLTRERVRPAIEHAQHLRPEDVPRFAELNVVASLQPLHKADDGRYAEERLGPERLQSSYAFRDLLDSGAVVAFGSDWPVVSINPFEGLWAAVAAKTTEGDAFIPEQAITLEEALVCYTRNAAYKLHADGEAGMLAPGKSADFIMLDRDILSASDDELRETKVLLTVVGGKIVHDAR